MVLCLPSQKMKLVSQVRIVDETACILHSTNTVREGMNPTILPLAIGYQLGGLGSLTNDIAINLREGKL